ncbi:MAG TPA: peptidase S8, partial [Chromatiales bacterium]|nr:peptidase S8 [Chromatiales bacterium]
MATEAGGWLRRELSPQHYYRVGLTGFAASMSSAEAQRLGRMPGVKAVHPNVTYTPQLDAGPEWIGARDIWDGPAGLNSEGEGVVIGIIDGGINWEHPFFADVGGDGFDHTNPRGSQFGLCSQAEVLCNDKLIGVYDFTTGNTNGRDGDDHGSHVASIAAGNRIAGGLEFAPGIIVPINASGVAPHANIISYKVCVADGVDGSPGSCSGGAILAAIEQAIVDQVDVINMSLGALGVQRPPPWLDLIADTLLDARGVGIISSLSAGNAGPLPNTISSSGNAPWVMAAGNITHDRIFGQTATNLSGGVTPPPDPLVGGGLTQGLGPRRIVYAGDFGFPLCGSGPAELAIGCNPGDPDPLTGASNPFTPGTFNGEIVVCDRGNYGRIEKSFNVRAGGASGMILANTQNSLANIASDAHCVPSVHIDADQGDDLRNWLLAGDNHQGLITPLGRVQDDAFANQLSFSSSRGPNNEIAGIVKPNLVAPGSNILGASADGGGIAFLSGTSMASPHVAGAAALLLGVNPAWTPAQVQSALETTAIPDDID